MDLQLRGRGELLCHIAIYTVFNREEIQDGIMGYLRPMF